MIARTPVRFSPRFDIAATTLPGHVNGVAQDNEGACDDTTSGGIITPFQLFKNFIPSPIA